MSDPKEYVAGSSSLVMGCDGYTSPAELGDTEYISGMNVVCRGGILQTRPGSRSLFCLPSGNFQGATLFTPDNGTAQLVAAVDGKIYVSAAPFTSYRRLANVQFSITSKYVAWAITLKSTDFDLEGNLITLDNPYSILIMQDGATRAAYWDGGTSGHLNPGYPADVTDVVPGFTETPIGLWMIWSGNRLWVSRGNQVFASDIGNPLKFTEGLYLNEGRAFYLSGPCTGMIELPSDSNGPKGFIAFTETNGTLFSSYIQDRTQWLNTPLFQNTIIPNVGCVAPRSLVTQYGLTWWFGPRGLANINSALRQNITSRIDYQDNEMFSSKAYLGPDLSGICGSFYENYLMMSVPSCDVLNRHTWVLDQAPMDGNANAWTGFWSGWRPVEWCRGIVNGSERVFFGSIDYDGSNRIWEAFIPEKTDNGCAITCYAQLRDHAAGNLDQKKYDWSKFFLSQLYGEVDLNIYVAATKGGYQLQKGYHLVASKGQIFSDVQYSEDGPFMIGNRFQSRTIRTPSGLDDNECNSCGVESKEGNKIDYAFSHLLVWSGQMGIRAYQMHMQESPERQAGDCEEDEVAPRTLNAAGCSGLELLVDGQPFETFTDYAEGITQTSYGTDIYIRRTATSPISQANAKSMAECAVQQIINQLKDSDIAPGVFDSAEAEIGSGTYVVVNYGIQANADMRVSLNGDTINSGGDVDFGETEYLQNQDFVFLIENTGNVPIAIYGINISGDGYSITVQPSEFIGIGESTTFTVHFEASSAGGGVFPCVITIQAETYFTINGTILQNAGGCVTPDFGIPVQGISFYANLVAAEAAMAEFVYSCMAYVIPPGEGGDGSIDSYVITGGSTIVISEAATRVLGYPLDTISYVGANLSIGDTLSVDFLITQPDGDEDPSQNIRFRIYNNEWLELNTQTSALLSGTINYVIPATGAYIIELHVYGKSDSSRSSDTHMTANLTLSSSGSFSSNEIVALYESGGECPSQLICT